ncbi:hypothetical protein M0802_008913 [Mischocyttarus mexicanus]|nr:hypothetical protein M0802_008913 [Mischocyttarus mexicanus]
MAEATTLMHQKVWFEKPSYDKAERLYFERMAKVMSNKIIRSYTINNDNSVINKHEDLININASMKSNLNGQSEESNDNKSLHSDDLKKENKCNALKMYNICNLRNICNYTVNTKCTSKEVKENKNKADTRHRNKGKGKDNIKEQQEQLPNKMDDIAVFAKESNSNQDVGSRIATLEKDNQDLRNVVQELRHIIEKLDKRVNVLEEKQPSLPLLQICPAKPPSTSENKSPKEEDGEDIDLFGSDSEANAETAKIREERLAAYAAKKAKKPALIAKSNIIFDVKPWDDETDMKDVEVKVRKIETDGLLWGAAKLVPLAFGIHKLQISCVVEDEKVSVDWLTEQIQEIDDLVQSVDIAAFNKI